MKSLLDSCIALYYIVFPILLVTQIIGVYPIKCTADLNQISMKIGKENAHLCVFLSTSMELLGVSSMRNFSVRSGVFTEAEKGVAWSKGKNK